MEDKIDRERIYQPISQPNRIFKTVLSSSSSAMSCDNHHKQMAGAHIAKRDKARKMKKQRTRPDSNKFSSNDGNHKWQPIMQQLEPML